MDHYIVELAGGEEGRTGGYLVCFCSWVPTIKDRSRQHRKEGCGHPVPPRACSHRCSVEMEAYVCPLEETQAWGWGGGPKISTPDHWVILALALFSYLLDGAIESDLSYKDPV